MLRRSVATYVPKALSPYAQALKQVSLKGPVAFGSSAKEMEFEMYRQGVLPADYRPPAQGKWDDTIERWAYAWQFPSAEESEDEVSALIKNREGVQLLLELGERLLEAPPSTIPGSGATDTTRYPLLDVADSPGATAPPPLLLSDEAAAGYAEMEKSVGLLAKAPKKEVMSVESFSQATAVPVAYLDDQSERANASKALALALESCDLEYAEEGLITAISALSQMHHYDAARALFDFSASVGIGPSAELFKALMRHASAVGDVNQSMALIEEMKDRGITPRIGNWHELMRSFHKARDYPAVSQIVDNMKMYANIEPNEVTFMLQLRALAKDTSQLNSLAEAVQLFDQMENVYGYIAARPHYDALMYAMSRSPAPEMRLRCDELARKMDLMGIPWNSTTFLNLIRSAQVAGDVEGVERYLSKMREDRVPVRVPHLSWAIHAHTQYLLRLNYEEMREKGEDPAAVWVEHMNTCFGIYELVVQRGWEMQVSLLNALLRLTCQVAILSVEHSVMKTESGAAEKSGAFEDQANKIWNDSFDEWHVQKDVFSYECYIALLAHQQRIDEAEKLFQEIILKNDMVPSRRTYECLIFMHLSSGEEGGAARALHYLEAMEKSQLPIRPSLLKKIVRVNNASGYKRDMKRRARRIMQAREEYLARKSEGVGFPSPGGDTAAVVDASDGDEKSSAPTLRPLPISEKSTLAWWDKWKKTTLSKHELFEEENADGTPRGESFEDKNKALAMMGIDSAFKTPDDVPDLSKQRLLPALRAEEGEVTGSLWALDGGELAYPRDGGGPQGWGVRLWRERQLLKKEFQKTLDGKAPVPSFSELGKASRVAGDQMDIEESGAKTPGELDDWRKFADNRYDDGTAKPVSEIAFPVEPSAELVWRGESRDPLAPYKTDNEIALESDNTFYNKMQSDVHNKTKELVSVLQEGRENDVDIVGRGPTRRSKIDYLEKWREMYRHGTLEMPDEPSLHFGRAPDDHRDTLAASVRDWYKRNKKAPLPQEKLDAWRVQNDRSSEASASRSAPKRPKKRIRKN